MAAPATDIRYLIPLIGFTASTGVVDAVSYLSLNFVFTANMTGNVLFLGFDIGGANVIHWLNVVVALFGFALGVVACSRIVGRAEHPTWMPTRMPTRNLLVLTAAGLAVVILSLVWVGLGDLGRIGVLTVTGILSVCMGVQAGGVRATRIRDVNTIVVTIAFANLAYDSHLAGSPRDRMWGRRLAAVLALAVGAAVGSLVVRLTIDPLALLLGGIVMLASTALMLSARRHEARTRGVT